MNTYQKFKYLKLTSKLLISALLMLIMFSIFCSCKVLQEDILKGIFCFVAVISSIIQTISIINNEYKYIKMKEARDKMRKQIYQRHV